MIGDRRREKIWEHVWGGEVRLRDAFPSIYRMAAGRILIGMLPFFVPDGAIVWDCRLRMEVLD